jgi:uncharacterized protein with HEPN domain
MQRDSRRAYLDVILEAAAAIEAATVGANGESYGSNRLIRSAVEREFIIVGAALRVICQRDPELVEQIPEDRQIIDFRKLLTHEYLNVSYRIVWGAIKTDLPLLIQHCAQALQQLNQETS